MLKSHGAQPMLGWGSLRGQAPQGVVSIGKNSATPLSRPDPSPRFWPPPCLPRCPTRPRPAAHVALSRRRTSELPAKWCEGVGGAQSRL